MSEISDKIENIAMYDMSYLGRTALNKGHMSRGALPLDAWTWPGSTGKTYPWPNLSNIGTIVGVKIDNEWHFLNKKDLSKNLRYRLTESADMLIDISDIRHTLSDKNGIYPVCGKTIDIGADDTNPYKMYNTGVGGIKWHRNTYAVSFWALLTAVILSLLLNDYIRSAERQIKELSSRPTIVKVVKSNE